MYRDRWGGVPGVWDWVGAWEGYTGVLPSTLPGPHIELILASGPYPRPNEAKYTVFNEVSQDGSRKGPRKGPELTRIDPESTLPDWS